MSYAYFLYCKTGLKMPGWNRPGAPPDEAGEPQPRGKPPPDLEVTTVEEVNASRGKPQ